MELLFILSFSAYNNGMRALKKGQSAWLWGFITLVAMLFTFVIATAIVMFGFYRGPLNNTQWLAFLRQNLIHTVFIYAGSIGGYLAIRYILDRMQPKQLPRKEEE